MPLMSPNEGPGETQDRGPQRGGPARITLVESEACHFCEDALQALDQLAREHEFLLDVVELRSPAGQALAQRHRPAMTPLVLVDDEFFSHGRLPRRKLAKLLIERHDAALAADGVSVRRTHG